jgi:hypothetical protein
MTCEEFERVLPEIEGAHSAEQESHLHSCSVCSELVDDLNAIALQARLLRDSENEEPAPGIWNSIEIALRQEGLIRDLTSAPYLVPARPRPRRLAWLIPAGALLLLTFGLVQHERPRSELTPQVPIASANPEPTDAANSDDQQLLEVVSARSPAMRASYAASLRDVNSYIRDAEQSVKTDPNDVQAQQYLMSAYEQKSMLYQIALDRPLQQQ